MIGCVNRMKMKGRVLMQQYWQVLQLKRRIKNRIMHFRVI